MGKLQTLPSAEQALPGRSQAMLLDYRHAIFDIDMRETPSGCEEIYLALGCFWGAERLFWQLPGVVNTAVGYAGGLTENPTYDEVCSGLTGHTEVVRIVYDPSHIKLEMLLKTFWEAHDPTQGMRQGNDVGTQYRSAIYGTSTQQGVAQHSAQLYTAALRQKGLGPISTEIAAKPTFYFAEQYHQQYLHKVPHGYCGLKGTGAICPI